MNTSTLLKSGGEKGDVVLESIREQRDIRVYDSYDVIIIGGGVAGMSAALAARRNGMRTLLVEKAAFMGGLATLGHVCLYLPLCDGNGRKVIGGISEELLHLSIQYGYNDLPEGWTRGILHHPDPKGRYKTWFNIPAFVLAADELMENEGVEILYDTVFCEPVMDGKTVTGVIVENKSGRCAYKAKMVVDASGDADVLYRAGAACFDRPTILSYWCYETDFKHMRKALESGNIRDAVVVPMMGLLPKIEPEDMTGERADKPGERGQMREYYGTDGKEVSQYLQVSRKFALERLKERMGPEYTQLSVAGMGAFRTTRRITGCYELHPEDMNKHFDDSIGCTGDWRKAGPVYEIPYRCLIDPEVQNVFAAGRIIASADDAWEVTRVIPTAAMTGEAAGTAAALAVRSDCTSGEVNVAELQKILANNGVILHI